ncbi:MAG: hypothetical protein ACOYL6_07500 [Bacteriovoracaceae bacterium]
MLKKILFYTFVLVIAGTTAFVVYKFKTVPEQIVPYPYVLIAPPPVLSGTSSIALMGDRMGKKLGGYLPFLEEAMSKGLATPLKIDNYTAAHEGLHRTLQKLKSLKKMPKIILYHGGSEEFFEKKFRSKDAKKILQNFTLYGKSAVQTALLFSPMVSHFIYQAVDRIDLNASPMYDDSSYEASEALLRLEVEFKLYTQEFQEFVEYVKSHDSVLILISTPYNLDVIPRKVCESSITSDYKAQLPNIENLKKEGDYKSILSLITDVLKTTPGNAILHYELGMALKNLGRKNEAIDELELAMAYDCELWRGGEVFNTITRRIAAKEEIFYFDFSQYVKDQWGMNELFFDELYPQNLYYERAMGNLGSLLKQHLKI